MGVRLAWLSFPVHGQTHTCLLPDGRAVLHGLLASCLCVITAVTGACLRGTAHNGFHPVKCGAWRAPKVAAWSVLAPDQTPLALKSSGLACRPNALLHQLTVTIRETSQHSTAVLVPCEATSALCLRESHMAPAEEGAGGSNGPASRSSTDASGDRSFWDRKAAFSKVAAGMFASRTKQQDKSDRLCAICPGLFLSSCQLETDKPTLQAAGITHILQVGLQLGGTAQRVCSSFFAANVLGRGLPSLGPLTSLPSNLCRLAQSSSQAGPALTSRIWGCR